MATKTATIDDIDSDEDFTPEPTVDLSLRELRVKVRGVAPLICHNGQLADPLNEYVIAMKLITSIKANKRTPDQDQRLRDLEWEGGLYLNEKKQPIIPGDVIEALIVEGAKKFAKGREFKSGTMCPDDPIIEFSGPKSLEKLKADKNFWDYRGVKIGMSRIFRTRPIFVDWGLTFTVQYIPDVVSEEQIRRAIDVCGRLIGLCEIRPKYGRFNATYS